MVIYAREQRSINMNEDESISYFHLWSHTIVSVVFHQLCFECFWIVDAKAVVMNLMNDIHWCFPHKKRAPQFVFLRGLGRPIAIHEKRRPRRSALGCALLCFSKVLISKKHKALTPTDLPSAMSNVRRRYFLMVMTPCYGELLRPIMGRNDMKTQYFKL